MSIRKGCVTGTNIVNPQRALIKHYAGLNVSHRVAISAFTAIYEQDLIFQLLLSINERFLPLFFVLFRPASRIILTNDEIVK